MTPPYALHDGLLHEERQPLTCACGLTAITPQALDAHFITVFTPSDATGSDSRRHEPTITGDGATGHRTYGGVMAAPPRGQALDGHEEARSSSWEPGSPWEAYGLLGRRNDRVGLLIGADGIVVGIARSGPLGAASGLLPP